MFVHIILSVLSGCHCVALRAQKHNYCLAKDVSRNFLNVSQAIHISCAYFSLPNYAFSLWGNCCQKISYMQIMHFDLINPYPLLCRSSFALSLPLIHPNFVCPLSPLVAALGSPMGRWVPRENWFLLPYHALTANRFPSMNWQRPSELFFCPHWF